jgi:hypothetical protein
LNSLEIRAHAVAFRDERKEELINKSLVTGLVAGAAASLKMMNQDPEYARVLKVTPLTKTIRTPQQECHLPAKDRHQVIGSVVGAVIRGVLGQRFGGELRTRRWPARRRLCGQPHPDESPGQGHVHNDRTEVQYGVRQLREAHRL